jgi:hypothetical protein
MQGCDMMGNLSAQTRLCYTLRFSMMWQVQQTLAKTVHALHSALANDCSLSSRDDTEHLGPSLFGNRGYSIIMQHG